jgi:muramoyltetrapeptide carboxypeptidase LdcA involved in peptidoglycan recycling
MAEGHGRLAAAGRVGRSDPVSRNIRRGAVTAGRAAILFGRPGGHALPLAAHAEYDEAILGVRDEFALAMPIITGMDFGHTDPFFVLPYGVRADIDCAARTFSIIEPAIV